jgi:hypothetical protein
MTFCSNFGQMGPCCRHKIEDVVAVCVGFCRHLPDFPKCVCRNILWYGSTYAKKNRHNAHPTSTGKKRENTHYSFTIRCTTAPSAHASYKGYGCNNAKPPRPPHRNTIIDVEVLGCGPIRTGEGAAAPFIGVHILGKIWLAGGFDTLATSRWEDQIGPSIPVQKINHTTINRRGPLYVWRIGRGMERRPCLWRQKLGGIFNA